MQAVLRQVDKVAPQKTTVLIHGESGTGKELVARALHERSARAAMPFVAVNCGAIPGELLETELFGHARGAFTDAVRAKKGLAVEADGGTLFLDEIGELTLPLQVKLLRFLQEEEVRPVGRHPLGEGGRAGGGRLGAGPGAGGGGRASSGRTSTGGWRWWGSGCRRCASDRVDLEPLARHFLARFAPLRPEVHGLDFAPEALERLRAHRWPGNVRELMHAVERAVVLAEGPVIREEDLPEAVRAPGPAPAVRGAPGRGPLGQAGHPGRSRSGSSARPWPAPAGTGPAPPSCSTSPTGRCSTRSRSTGWGEARARRRRRGE